MGVEHGDLGAQGPEDSRQGLTEELKAMVEDRASVTSEDNPVQEDEASGKYDPEYLAAQADRLRGAVTATEVYIDPEITDNPVPLPEGMTVEQVASAMEVMDKLRRHYEDMASAARMKTLQG